jgi:5,10-methylenetetrahydrofolate reductase
LTRYWVTERKNYKKDPKAIKGELLPILTDMFTKYRIVSIALEIMYVNNIPFLVSISRHLRFGTTDGLKDLKNTTIINAIKQILNIYKERDFKVSLILAERQFESIKTNIAGMGISTNITG